MTTMTTTTSPDWTSEEIKTVFSDLTPIPQDDGPHPVSQIDYKEDFRLAYDYFRAVLHQDERSERALHLTALCLKLNPANYTVWHFRRLCLLHNDKELFLKYLDHDFQMAAKFGGDNPKNYQIWYHRRALLEEVAVLSSSKTDDLFDAYAAKELEYMKSVIAQDGKNYHAWSHRQWLVTLLNRDDLWESEKQYTDELIQLDPRNNSAWNHRWFVVHQGNFKSQTGKSGLDIGLAKREADYALEGAKMDPYNESPWRYFIAILNEQVQKSDDANKLILLQEYEDKTWALQNVLRTAGRDPENCPALLAAAMDLLEWKGDDASLERVVSLAQRLGNEFDPIRRKYWAMRATLAQEKLKQR